MINKSVKILWISFLSVLSLIFLLFVCANFGLFGKMPSLEELQNPDANLASEIISSDGVLMGKLYAENRSEVKYSEISPNAINALIATEDERFYDHSGIDAQAIGRVVYTFGTQGGGSTLTQQLAKMILRQGKGNVAQRGIQKIKEWILAVKLERNFTKQEIIALYLNWAPWGNVYGIRNASRTYFQKEPIDLTIEEAAVLIGMLKGFIYDPIRHPDKSLARRNVVINQMVAAKQKFLTPNEAERLKKLPLKTNYKKIDENVGMAPYFRFALSGLLKEWCKTHKNPRTNEPYDLYRDGLKIYTTIDSRMQAYAERSVEEHMPAIQRKLDANLKYNGKNIWKGHESVVESAIRFSERWKSMKEEGIDSATIRKTFNVPVKMKIFSWSGDKKHEKDTIMTPYDSIKYHKQLLQTSFACMDARTGEVKAWVGGINFKWFKYDHILAKRQVGSTFKPLVYALAVKDAGYTPQTAISGGPLTLGGKTISSGGGTMAYCLANSLNGAAWRLMSLIGVERTIQFSKQCGIKTELPHYPSIALGAAEIPLMEMLQMYTMFPNRGFNIPPVYVNRIEDKNGNLIHEFDLGVGNQVMSEAEAFSMVKMMQGVIQFGTARRLNGYNIPVQKAGKTGTTNGNTDGWFIGYTPELLAGTWVGCEDPFIPIYSNNSGGAEMSAPKWGLFMSKVYADSRLNYGQQKEFIQPPELLDDPIYAEANFANIAKTGDSLSTDDLGNGSADDFMLSDYESGEFGADSTIPSPDTGGKKNKPKSTMKPIENNDGYRRRR